MTLSRRGFLTGSGALLAATALTAAPLDLLQIEGPAFGASWRARVGTTADAAAAIRRIMGVVDTVDAAMSPFRTKSEISVFNRTETTDWLPLSPVTLATIAEAQRIASLTRGAFDPTLGGLVGRFGFGPMTAAPDGAFGDLALGESGARKAAQQQTLDLCGIAKGLALDRCVAGLEELGLGNFILEMGGEVMARGRKPDGSSWRAAVEHPDRHRLAPHCVVALEHDALATSGDLINSFAHGGLRYSHIMDPRRKAPARSALASVSVLAPKAITADALATALFAMGSDRGPAFAQAAGIDALFLSRDGPGLRQVMTGCFADRITWR